MKFLKPILFFLLVLLCILQWLSRVYFVCASPYPLDFNGFYYLYEFRHRLKFGSGFYHDTSFFFWLSAWIGIGSGFDALQLYQFWVIFCLAAFAVGLALLAPNVSYAGTILAYLALQSEPLFFLMYGYLRQALGCVFLVWILLISTKVSSKRLSITACFTLSLFTALTHIWAGIIGLGAIFLLPSIPLRNRFLTAIVMGIACLSLYPLSQVTQLVSQISLGFGLSWNAPNMKGLLSPLELTQHYLYFTSSIIGIFLSLRTSPFSALCLYFSVMALVTGVPHWYGSAGIPFRFLLSSTPLCLISIALLPVATRIKSHRTRIPLYLSLLFSVSVLLWSLIPRWPRPIGPAPGISLILPNIEILNRWLPPEAFVLAPPGIQYQVRYFLDRPSARELSPQTENFYKITFEPQVDSEKCPKIKSVVSGNLSSTSCLELAPGWIIRKSSLHQ